MADYIFIRKSRNVLSSVLHVILNILLGVGSIFVTVVSGSWVIGIILVLISKWRMFAVQPRYWWVNIKSNIVDLVVGCSLVLLAYYSGNTLLLIHFILSAIYVAWLIIIKPLSSEGATLVQALIAIFLGSSTVSIMCASTSSLLAVALSFIVGYGASRHVLIQNEEEGDGGLTALVCGLVFSEITWLCHSWMIVYTFGTTGIRIPQLAIILSLLAFAFHRVYQSIVIHDGKLKLADIALPTIFSLLIVAILVFGFSQPIFNV